MWWVIIIFTISLIIVTAQFLFSENNNNTSGKIVFLCALSICLAFGFFIISTLSYRQTYRTILKREIKLENKTGSIKYNVQYKNAGIVTYYVNPKDKKAFEQKIKEFGGKIK